MKFIDKLLTCSRSNDSLLCIGLDPDPQRMPIDDVLSFNKSIVDATKDVVCAYKPNLAFYEALGLEGLKALQKTVEYIPGSIPVIGDGKRSDIGNTSRAYAHALYDVYGFDAITVSPYLGHDSISPFLGYQERGVFILCRTSNPGSADFQELKVRSSPSTEIPLYLHVALNAREWNTSGNIGLVVGATFPGELKKLREVCPDMPILIPGIGPQGGELEAAVTAGVDERQEMALIASSRQVLYASPGSDFAEAARMEALKTETADKSVQESDAVIDFKIGDVVRLKKVHPCGSHEWDGGPVRCRYRYQVQYLQSASADGQIGPGT